MVSRMWVLVEWADESNVLPSYGIVNVDTSIYAEVDLNPGKYIFVRIKHDNPKRAKILRISESKRYIREQKDILERQDQQVKNMLQLCMRTIKEIKSDNSFNSERNLSSNHSTHGAAMPHVIATNSNSDSDSDLEPDISQSRSRKSVNKIIHASTPRPSLRKEVIKNHARNTYTGDRTIFCSTPISGSGSMENVKLFFDQSTQTEGTYVQPQLAKIKEMETVLTNLYTRFQVLISQVNTNANVTQSMSEFEHNHEEQNDEPIANELWAEPMNPAYAVDQIAPPGNLDQINPEQMQVAEENGEDLRIKSANIKTEASNANTLKVRRMSAQTTNNIEATASCDLVPIGHGNAKVPARLLNEIDWNWHTSATRQLLQAIFPRKVLATHSLTGKQSPAFKNRPPKKILDQKLVEDIVMTVSNRCRVPKNLVRNSITIKCTDEAKLYRNRQQYRQGRKTQQDDENIPPSTPTSEESANAVLN